MDRRLMQDDNRGLGQGLKDNKITCNRFRLLLERRTTVSHEVHQEQEHSTSYPSLLSHLTSMYLNTPPLVLPVAKRQGTSPTLHSFHPLASPLPCDFHLLNLRTFPAEVSVPVRANSHHQALTLLPALLCPALPSWLTCC